MLLCKKMVQLPFKYHHSLSLLLRIFQPILPGAISVCQAEMCPAPHASGQPLCVLPSGPSPGRQLCTKGCRLSVRGLLCFSQGPRLEPTGFPWTLHPLRGQYPLSSCEGLVTASEGKKRSGLGTAAGTIVLCCQLSAESVVLWWGLIHRVWAN